MRLSLWLSLAPAAAVGIGRFAYALVLPGMQTGLSLSYAEAGLLGSANTAGYLAGALISHRVLDKTGYRSGVFAALLLQTLSLALLAGPESLTALAALRFAQGVLGAFVFVGGAALLLASGGRGAATGLYFAGVGLGIAVSPLALPLAADWQSSWLVLAGLSLAMTVAAFSALPLVVEPAPKVTGSEGSLRPIRFVLAVYGLYGAGYIGYMTFVTSTLAVSLGLFWALLGVAAMTGSALWGRWTERVGGARSLTHVLFVMTAASAYPLVVQAPWLSAMAYGVSFLGVLSAVTDVFSSRLPPGAWARAMGISTAAFAVGQAIGPGFSGLFGDLLGGPHGALALSTLLLGSAWFIALWHLRSPVDKPGESKR